MKLLAVVAALAIGQPAFELKLTHRAERERAARKRLVGHFAQGGGMVTRPEWESWLAPPAGDAFTPVELEALRKRQDRVVEAALRHARHDSKISLDQVRALGKVEEFCSRLPKGGLLHFHPGLMVPPEELLGILKASEPVLRPALLFQVLGKAGRAGTVEFLKSLGEAVPFSALTPAQQAELSRAFYLPRSPIGVADILASYEAWSQVRKSATRGDPARAMWRAFLDRLKREKVSYVEVTESWPPDFAAAAVRPGDPELRYLAAIPRERRPEELRALAKSLRAEKDARLVGYNLMGDEGEYPVFETAQSFFAELDSRRGMTAHAGAGRGPVEVRDAIALGAGRIGHGTRIGEDPVLLEVLARRKTPLEANLTGNLRFGVIASARAHPFLRLLRLGLRVTLSTDNDQLFGTDMNQECRLTVGETDLQYSELKRMVLDSIETSFADASLKRRLRARLGRDLAEFERGYPRG